MLPRHGHSVVAGLNAGMDGVEGAERQGCYSTYCNHAVFLPICVLFRWWKKFVLSTTKKKKRILFFCTWKERKNKSDR